MGSSWSVAMSADIVLQSLPSEYNRNDSENCYRH